MYSLRSSLYARLARPIYPKELTTFLIGQSLWELFTPKRESVRHILFIHAQIWCKIMDILVLHLSWISSDIKHHGGEVPVIRFATGIDCLFNTVFLMILVMTAPEQIEQMSIKHHLEYRKLQFHAHSFLLKIIPAIC